MEARIILSTLLLIINRQEELRMGPIRFYVWILLATCEQNCDDTDIAIQHFRHTLALVDNSPTLKAVLAQDAIHDARYRLAQMYITTGKSREALPLLSAVVDDLHAQDPSSPLLLSSEDVLARIHLRLNQPESAIRLLTTVIERRRKLLGVSDVNFLRAQTISVEAYMAVGKLILAERVFSQVEDACKVSLSLQGALRGEMTELANKLQGMHDALNKQESLGDADDVNELPKSKL
ncbi:hypothetical protein NM208_g6528 [Fusarium decemcellulare]|uniref:Uncharacterized protein n=1 Tax=Fusarium decemcellulare TaxID=57161 RepID=A0ACC1SCP8_9HYPO|nr:hypothetical protein NM208_g6528 [Fusarium decemcellulare]